VIAGAVATWYFTRDKSTLHLTVFVSVWRVFRYHLGTVAFGAFIIALVQLIRLIMKYLEKKAREVFFIL
jgi:solute carrier family 44 protein 1 (choline transporter-like protein)